MKTDINILSNASALAQYARRSHNVIAQNIANADTPGYKAKELKPFSEIYDQSIRQNRQLADMIAEAKPKQSSAVSDPNGNSVSLEEQMFAASKALGDHDMAVLVYRKTLDMLKLAIGKNI